MSSILSAEKTVEVVASLKAIIDELATRAEKLNEELRTQTAREQRRHEAALEEQTAKLTAAGVEQQALYETAKTAAQAAFERLDSLKREATGKHADMTE